MNNVVLKIFENCGGSKGGLMSSIATMLTGFVLLLGLVAGAAIFLLVLSTPVLAGVMGLVGLSYLLGKIFLSGVLLEEKKSNPDVAVIRRLEQINQGSFRAVFVRAVAREVGQRD